MIGIPLENLFQASAPRMILHLWPISSFSYYCFRSTSNQTIILKFIKGWWWLNWLMICTVKFTFHFYSEAMMLICTVNFTFHFFLEAKLLFMRLRSSFCLSVFLYPSISFYCAVTHAQWTLFAKAFIFTSFLSVTRLNYHRAVDILVHLCFYSERPMSYISILNRWNQSGSLKIFY